MHAKVFSIQIFQYLRQIPPRVCTLVLFIIIIITIIIIIINNIIIIIIDCTTPQHMCSERHAVKKHDVDYCDREYGVQAFPPGSL